MASKADVLAGLMPSAELGTGSATSTTCLLGNQSWGPCGSSSNAVQIQGVPVDTAAPGDNQVITYVAADGKYEPRPGGGVTTGMQAMKYASDFNWSQTPSADLSTAGAQDGNTFRLSSGGNGGGAAILRLRRGDRNCGSGAGDGRDMCGKWSCGDVAIYDGELPCGGVHGGERLGGIAGGTDCGTVHAEESDS